MFTCASSHTRVHKHPSEDQRESREDKLIVCSGTTDPDSTSTRNVHSVPQHRPTVDFITDHCAFHLHPMTRVAYIWSAELQACADQLPANLGRSSLVHGLVHALGLVRSVSTVESPECSPDTTMSACLVSPEPTLATEAELRRYHDARYVGE